MTGEYSYKRVPRGAELRDLLERVVQLIDELEKAMTRLPNVSEDGDSDCHFARELYAKKQRLEQAVMLWVQELHRFLGYLRKEAARCLKNLEIIRADAKRLNLDETRRCYSEAESEQEREYRLAAEDRDAVYVVLKRAVAVLEVSTNRNCPDILPKTEGSARPDSGISRQAGPGTFCDGGSGSEYGDLMSLGPFN